MIKVILFDCDGVIVHRGDYFNIRMEKELGIKIDHEAKERFFKGDFLLCETGKKDLKQELSKHLKLWNIDWTLEEVLKFWFEGEKERDERVVNVIKILRKKGLKCYLSTNNEKYRTEYLADEVGLRDILDGIFSSAYLGYLKPDLKYWEEIYKQLGGVKKEEVLVFDNKENMANSAKEFGFNSEFFTTFENFQKQLQKYQL